MKRIVLLTVAACILALALPGVAMAARPTTYWPGGTKVQIAVVNNYVTISWPAITGPGPLGYYGVMVWERHSGDDGLSVGLATSYTFPYAFRPGIWHFRVDAISPGNASYDSITAWVRIE